MIWFNISGETIDDWELEFSFKDEIENIWKAKVMSHDENIYVVRNDDWNQDIPADGKVTFGMTIQYNGEIEPPEYCYLTRESQPVQGTYEVTYKQNSQWNGYVNGQIVITNKSDQRIEDWKLDLISNLEIENIWNGKISSKYEDIYRIDNMQYNQNIEIGASVEFGFIAKCSDEVKIDGYVLNEMTSAEFVEEELDDDYNEEDEDNDDIEYPDDYIFEPDDFETYEQYARYLIKSQQFLMPQLYSIPPNPKYIVKKVNPKYNLRYVTKDNEKANISTSVQNHLINGDNIFTLQRSKANIWFREGVLDKNKTKFSIPKKGAVKLEASCIVVANSLSLLNKITY